MACLDPVERDAPQRSAHPHPDPRAVVESGERTQERVRGDRQPALCVNRGDRLGATQAGGHTLLQEKT